MSSYNEQKWERLTKLLGELGSSPSPDQLEILKCNNKIVLVSGGEQGGKSTVAAQKCVTHVIELIARLVATGEKRKVLVWLVGDDYEQSRKEFEYTKDMLLDLGAVDANSISMPKRGAWSMNLINKMGEIVTKTAKDVSKLGREAPDAIFVNEAAQVGYDVYLRCLGRTGPRDALLFLSGTLESSTDWYSEALQKWRVANKEGAKAFVLPTWANPILYPGGENNPKIQRLKKLLPKDEFDRRFGAVPTPPPNLALPEFSYRIHVPGDIGFQPLLPVQLWIDTGYSGSFYAVEVAQIVDPDHHCDMTHAHIVDEIYVKGAQTGIIIEEFRARPWVDNVELIVIDIAGTQHHAMPSHAEMFAAEGYNVVWEYIPVEDGILRHRTMLRHPATEQARLFYNEACAGALKEYGRWVRRNITGLMNQAAKPQIINCDAMKAVNYGLIHNFGFVDVEIEPPEIKNPFPF